MALDKKDKEILFELSKNSRQPFSKIAKKLKISKETCTYKVHKLIDDGIISNFLTLVSLGKFGLNHYKIYFQLHGASKEIIDGMIDSFTNYYKINWIAKCTGTFDLIISILCKDVKEFNNEKNKILNTYSDYIQNYSVGIMVETYVYGKDYLVDTERSSLDDKKMIGFQDDYKLDPVDKKILSLIVNNSRMPAIEISKKSDVNIKTVISRLKKLEENKIIFGYDIFFDFNKMNLRYYKLFISISKMVLDRYNDFLGYAKNNKNIIYLIENISSWELELEIEIESDKEFYEIVDDIKNKFPDFIKRLDVVRITNDYKHIYVTEEVLESL